MEVPTDGRPTERRLTRLRTSARSLAPYAVVAAAASALVAAQPVGAPWWLYADADGTYSASALNIVSGGQSRYFDHPGLPTQQVLALTFGAVSLAHGGPTRSWAADEMLDLDRARPVFRGWAIAFFVGGALLLAFLLTRAFGHWTWGVAGGLLWLAQPDLTDAIQIRPDVLLAAVSVGACYLAVRAAERRSAGGFLAAAAAAGFALMVKVHAVALLPMLLVAAALYHPGEGWAVRLREATAETFRRRRGTLTALGLIWLGLFLALNWGRFTVQVRNSHAAEIGVFAFVVFDYALAALIVPRLTRNRVARRLFDPLYLLLALAFAVGVLVPLSLVLIDSLHVLVATVNTLRGGNVNSGIKPFAMPISRFASFPLLEAVVVLAVAAVAAAVGVARRAAWPWLWFLASATATILAWARLGEPRYFALGYVLAIPAALWLFRRRDRARAPIVAWLLVAVVVLPTFLHMRDAAHAAAQNVLQDRAASRLADRLLKPGELALVSNYFPNPDIRWWGLVNNFVTWSPPYPYRFVPDYAPAVQQETSAGNRIRYYMGRGALAVKIPTTLSLDSGTYRVKPVAGGDAYASTGVGAVEIVSGPGG